MFSFEGDFKSRRQINLGGQRYQEDRQLLLRRTQDQRKAREAERLRLKSATKIQAFYRGRKAASNARDSERSNWDQEAQIFLEKSGKWDAETAHVLTHLVRSFLFFYRQHLDSQRFLLCQILSKKSKDSEILFLPFTQDELREIWTYQMKRVLIVFLKNDGSGSIFGAIHYLRILQLAADHLNYQKLGGNIDGRKISSNIMEYLVSHDLYKEIRKYIIHMRADMNNTLSNNIIVDLLLNPLPNVASTSTLSEFINQILTIPLLPTRITIIKMPIEAVLLKLGKTDMNQWSIQEASALLGNMLLYASPKVSYLKSSYLLAYLKVLQNLSAQIPTHLLIDKSIKNTNAMLVDDDEDDEEGDVKKVNQQLPSENIEIDPQILEAIEELFNQEHLTSIFLFATRAETASLLKVANFLVTLMIRWPGRKDELLKAMTHGHLFKWRSRSAANVIWQEFKGTELAKKVQSQLFSTRIVIDSSFSEQWGLLILLCELFSRVLLVTGDDEFFEEEKNPLILGDIVDMSTFLRNIAFSLYWNYTSFKMESTLEGSCISLNYLRDAVTRTLRQIHARDSRRRFTSHEHWLMTSEFDMTAFNKAVVLEEQELEAEEADEISERRIVASTSPRLAVLNNIPFVIPFEERVKIFRRFVDIDRQRNYHNDFVLERRTRATIRRTHVFEDGFANLNTLGKELKRPVAISFIDEYGLPEAGIDGGGLFKEFLTALTRQAFDVDYGLFLSTKDNLLYPNPHAYARQEQQLNYYEFLGRILGKALYEGILIDAGFAGFFLSKWLGRLSYLDDLPSLDPELYQGLIFLKNYRGNVENELSLNFTAVDKEFGESRNIELIPGGRDIPVTEANRLQYIFMVANYRLNSQIQWQCKAFFRGLKDLIDEKWLRMFNQQELQILIGGISIPIDIDDLRVNTVYAGYEDNDFVIQNFWAVVKSFSEEQKQKFVKFVTSCSRPPLLGFKELNPKFSIRNAGVELRLPTSSTCVNLLKLPAYPDIQTMRKKLEYAINADAGFGLS
ncbi:hypothetical protein G9A89_012921 [Geosiphon pyriformis]|nr:hypothetical protein G9A89_012921 [Geosiphon pyriformis]